MSTTNRNTSRKAGVASLGSFGLLVGLLAGPVSAAPAQEASQPSSKASESRAGTDASSAAKADASAAKKAEPRVAKPKVGSKNEGPLDNAARRALRASSSRQRALPDAQRVAMRTVAPAAADADPPKRGKSKKKRGKKVKDSRASADAPTDPSDRKISLDEDFLVEGRLEKPNAFFILRRSQSAYDWARLDAKFLPLVLESVQDPLF